MAKKKKSGSKPKKPKTGNEEESLDEIMGALLKVPPKKEAKSNRSKARDKGQ